MLSPAAWCLLALSLLITLASLAPFTPAVALVVPVLPLAALLAWGGARLPALLTGLGCVAAVGLSPWHNGVRLAYWLMQSRQQYSHADS